MPQGFPLTQPRSDTRTEPKSAAQVAVIEPALIPEQPHEAEELQPEKADSASDAAGWQMVVGLSALLAMICSVDRAAMSVALSPMGSEFGWSDTVKGTISSSFFLGYTLTNFIGASDVRLPFAAALHGSCACKR